jgi:hypothetical protein
MFDVYIKRMCYFQRNTYNIGRDETWDFVKDKSFKTYEEALKHAVDGNRRKSDAVNDYYRWDDSKFVTFEEFLVYFTESSTYLTKRVYHVGKPSTKRMEEDLNVKVKNEK